MTHQRTIGVVTAGIAALSLTLSACGAVGGEGDATVLRVGHEGTPEEPLNQGLLRASEALEEATDGRLTIEPMPSGQLGAEKDVLEQVRAGGVCMTVPSHAGLSPFYSDAAAFALPYSLAGDGEREQYDTLQTLAESELIRTATDDMASDTDLRVIDWTWWYGNRHMTNSVRPVESPADAEGLVIRTPSAPVYAMPIESFGATAQPMSWSEMYLALQSGAVDGQENPSNTINVQELHKVQQYMTLTGHISQGEAVVIGDDCWQDLSEADREALVDAIQEAGDWQSEELLTANEEALSGIEESGMQVSTPDVSAFREATADAAERWAEQDTNFDLDFYAEFIEAQDG